MDEIKSLIELIKELPALALWVIAGFFAYKVICIGSIYGVIRLAITKFHDYLVTPPKAQRQEIVHTLHGITVDSCKDQLVAQVMRIAGKGINIQSQYVHPQSVTWLKEAIDAKETLERKDLK